MQRVEEYTLFAGNPEFSRNLWQEVTAARLIIPPVILALMIILIVFAEGLGNADKYNRIFMAVSSAGFVLVTVLWGVRLAADSLMQEFSEGTWDSQRMCGLKPVQVLWGKLFGGTITAWYVGALLLGLFVYGSWHVDWVNTGITLKSVIALVCCAVLMHAMCMSSVLAIWRKRGRQLGKGMRGVVAFPVFVVAFAFLGLNRFSRLLFYRYSFDDIEGNYTQWFGMYVEWGNVLLSMLIALTVWTVVGLWQQFRSELQFRNRPWWWLAFLLFWMVFLAGFVSKYWTFDGLFFSPWHAYLLVCTLFVLLTVYMHLFYERKDAMVWLRLLEAFKRREKDKIVTLFPSWAISLFVAAMLAMVLSIWVGVFSSATVTGHSFVMSEGSRPVTTALCLFLLSLLLFVLRDVMLVIWLNLSANNTRADGAAILYLVVLYFLLPWLAVAVFDIKAWFLFVPLVGVDGELSLPWLFILSPFVQVVVMGGLLVKRWKDRKGHISG